MQFYFNKQPYELLQIFEILAPDKLLISQNIAASKNLISL